MKKISRMAFATDSVTGGIAELVGSHFVNAGIKAFSFQGGGVGYKED